MYQEITVGSEFKDFHIVPTIDNDFKLKPKELVVEVDGLKDKLTPFYAIFHFKNKEEYGNFVEGIRNKLNLKPFLLSTKIRESNVFRDSKKKKRLDKPYSKWEFFNVEKLY